MIVALIDGETEGGHIESNGLVHLYSVIFLIIVLSGAIIRIRDFIKSRRSQQQIWEEENIGCKNFRFKLVHCDGRTKS